MPPVLWTVLDLAGLAAFAVSGALAGAGRRLDLFGLAVVALVTAVGGGTLRDLLLQRPVAWLAAPLVPLAVVAASVALVLLAGRLRPWFHRLLLAADAVGLGVCAVAGTRIALDAAAPWPSAVLLGVVTATAGGLVRDVLVNEVPLVLRAEIYATAALFGGLLCVLLPAGQGAALAAAAATVAVRLAAIRWRLSLPVPKAV